VQTKNAELKAGVVVVVAIVVLLAFLWISSGAEWPWTPHRSIWIRFEQGFAAPKVGDPVLMNGFEIGTVADVMQKEDRRSGASLTRNDAERLGIDWLDEEAKRTAVAREIYVLARAELPTSRVIPRGTVAQITVSVTGSRTLELKPGIFPDDLSDADTKAHPILASAAGDLSDIQRSVQSLVLKVSGLADAGRDAMADVRVLIKTVRDKVGVLDLGEIQENVKGASVSLRATLVAAQERLDRITADLAEAAASLKAAAASAGVVVADVGKKVDDVVADLKASSTEVKEILARAGPKVDAALDDVGLAARSLAGLGHDLEGVGPRLHAILGTSGSDLDKVLARLAEVGHNLQDASEYIRAHPWALLNKPDATEIAFENLRNAASNYVRAAGAVEEAAKALKSAEERKDLAPDDLKHVVEDALQRLRGDLARYQDAEARFTRLLREGGAVPSPAPQPNR
jgi:ABC-type transporter Mla subunit MlaD